jgi:CheY-like chemotaxis protein
MGKIRIAVGAPSSRLTEELIGILKQAGAEEVTHWDSGLTLLSEVVLHPYDGIILDADLPVLPAVKVREILKNNPRTQGTPVLLIDLHNRIHKDHPHASLFLKNPLRQKQWIHLLFRTPVEEKGVLKVSLSNLPLEDLLQMLLLSNRKGIVEVEHFSDFGRIEISSPHFGQISYMGKVFGVKALSRLLQFREGSARFVEKEEIPPLYLNGEHILFQAVKDRDEFLELRKRFPPGSTLHLHQYPTGTPPQGFSEELLNLLEIESRLDALLEEIPRLDGEILSHIKEFVEKGWVELRLPGEKGEPTQFWESIHLPYPVPAGQYLTIWVFGENPKPLSEFLKEPLLKEVLDARHSFVDLNRFGGNGWLLNLPQGYRAWLRFLKPVPEQAGWILRKGWVNIGAILVMGEDEPDPSPFEGVAQDIDENHLPVYWLLYSERSKDLLWTDIFGEDLPGKILKDPHPATAFLKGIRALLQGGRE